MQSIVSFLESVQVSFGLFDTLTKEWDARHKSHSSKKVFFGCGRPSQDLRLITVVAISSLFAFMSWNRRPAKVFFHVRRVSDLLLVCSIYSETFSFFLSFSQAEGCIQTKFFSAIVLPKISFFFASPR